MNKLGDKNTLNYSKNIFFYFLLGLARLQFKEADELTTSRILDLNLKAGDYVKELSKSE